MTRRPTSVSSCRYVWWTDAVESGLPQSLANLANRADPGEDISRREARSGRYRSQAIVASDGEADEQTPSVEAVVEVQDSCQQDRQASDRQTDAQAHT